MPEASVPLPPPCVSVGLGLFLIARGGADVSILCAWQSSQPRVRNNDLLDNFMVSHADVWRHSLMHVRAGETFSSRAASVHGVHAVIANLFAEYFMDVARV